MTRHEQTSLVQIDMLRALARSQHAVARMMDSAADAACELHLDEAMLREQLRALAGYQSSLIARLSGLRLRAPKQGAPAERPWLAPGVAGKSL